MSERGETSRGGERVEETIRGGDRGCVREGARERVGKRGGEGSEQRFRHLGVHTWYRVARQRPAVTGAAEML